MDGVYPSSTCYKQPYSCKDGKMNSDTGGTWVSNAFIRNRGQTSFVTMDYDEGYPDYLTNNTPATQLFVRVAPSQYDKNKKVFWINGWERPRLLLTRGKKYQFNVSTCGNPFYFTSDSHGGQGNKNNITQVTPSDYYVTTYTMADNVPQQFYYQSSQSPDMGGVVRII